MSDGGHEEKDVVLFVGNFDSATGYAWKLIESFWRAISEYDFLKKYNFELCYPTVSAVSNEIAESDIVVSELDFNNHLFSALALLIRKKVKVLYLTDQKTASVKYVLYRLCGVKKIVVHDHTPGVRSSPGRWKKMIKRIGSSGSWVSCDAAFAVSPYVERRLYEVNGLPANKIFSVTNGIDIKNMRSKEGVSSPVRIVTVSRANYYKGIDFALKVISRLVYVHAEKNFHYTHFGDGPDLDRFKKMSAELKIEEYVTFAGGGHNIESELNNADIALHPSRGEAMSLAILEYMKAGLAIVVSDNESVSSALKQDYDSVFYRSLDEASAADVVLSLINDNDKIILFGRRAQKSLKVKYSQEKMMLRLRECLSIVLD